MGHSERLEASLDLNCEEKKKEITEMECRLLIVNSNLDGQRSF